MTMNNRCLAVLLVAGVTLSSASAFAQPAAESPAAKTETELAERIEARAADIRQIEADAEAALAEKSWLNFYIANIKLHKLRRYKPEYMFNISRASSALDRRQTAYHYMFTMQQQGLSYDFNSADETENIRGTEAYVYLNDLMAEAGQPVGEAAVALDFEGPASAYVAIAWDGAAKRFLAARTSDSAIVSASEDGGATEVLKSAGDLGLTSLGGLAVDQERGRLLVAGSADDAAVLLELDLESLSLSKRHELPAVAAPRSPAAMEVTADGTAYIIDSNLPVVYRLTPGGERFESFLTHPELVALTDLAVTADGTRIYLSDYDMGILTVNLENGESGFLPGPDTLNMGGISGIEYREGAVFMIQDGIKPERVMRLLLSEDGTAIEQVAPMAIALQDFDGPGVSTIRDNQLLYLANRNSEDKAGEALVMATALDAGQAIVPPDMRMLNRDIEEKERAKAAEKSKEKEQE